MLKKLPSGFISTPKNVEKGELPSRCRMMQGFTLIELLVVIAIIGILASVVLTSVNSSRQKARDVRRISDLKQTQLALELYFDATNNTFPTDIYATSTGLAPTYMPSVPKDPLDGSQYKYGYCVTPAQYHLAAILEDSSNPNLSSAAQKAPLCSPTDSVRGNTSDCSTNGSVPNKCYDVTN